MLFVSGVILYLIIYLILIYMFTFVDSNYHVRVHSDKQFGNNFGSHLRSNCVLEIDIPNMPYTKYIM